MSERFRPHRAALAAVLLAVAAAVAAVVVAPGAARADTLLAAATAVAEQAKPAARRATVRHVPPAEAEAHRSLRLIALVNDAWVEARLVVRYRRLADAGGYREAVFERSSGGGYFATIPAGDVHRPGVEYYVVGVRADGGEEQHYASATHPHPVRIEPSADQRWVEAEERRLDGRRSIVRTRLEGLDFGGVNGQADQFLLGEIDFTHRLIGTLYSFSLGFGFLEGRTPSGLGEDAVTEDRAVRYGYGGLRYRLQRNFWLEGRAVMGVGRDGFIAGGGGAVILGQDWRSCVKLGAEYVQEMGKTAYLRLQWDTARPFIMGATATATDLPDADVASGSFITYDVTYPVTSQLSVGGMLSFGARGNRPGGFGGGLETRFEF